MDSDQLRADIREAFPDCDEATAARIADTASQYEAEMETDHSSDDWLSYMLDSDLDEAVRAWNWAVGYVDPSHWEDGNPYKLDP